MPIRNVDIALLGMSCLSCQLRYTSGSPVLEIQCFLSSSLSSSVLLQKGRISRNGVLSTGGKYTLQWRLAEQRDYALRVHYRLRHPN